MDPDAFLLAVSSYSRDPDFSVRANMATVLATLPADQVRGAVEALASDPDVRVQGPALRALVKVGAQDADQRIEAALKAPDFALRAAAAELAGERKPPSGVAWLDAAYTRAESDANDAARTAILTAIAKYPLAEARPTLERGLADREWPVRLVAASLLKQAGNTTAGPVRPAPTRQDNAFFESDRVLRPPYTPYAYIETRRGTIQIELDIVNAPVTVLSFMELARAGFFNAMKVHRLIPNFVIQAGDPRGDGEGGPGYTIRDELSPLPYVRGTVGMALSGRDTGGSQFFITLSPQPHLEGQYTVFGKVISGWDTLDQVTLWDVIDRIRIWDGTEK
jgi:cyclophilin family peptidyl-prolyl cis-trans isomerase